MSTVPSIRPASLPVAANDTAIPQHVLERLESEWRQMRDHVPAQAPAARQG